MIVVFVLILLLAALGTTFALHRYISFKSVPIYVYIVTWIGWFMCFGIIVLVPIDIICTNYRECLLLNNNDPAMCEREPISFVSEELLKIFYQVFYFGTLLLTWLVYPFLGSFVLSGDFKLTERISRSIKENIYLYLIFGVIGLIIMIWLLAVKQLDWNSMVGYVMAAANTWGLILVILLMGYGLIETPRNIWNYSNRVLVLRHLQFKLVTLLDAKKQTQDELYATLKAVKKIQEKTRKLDPYEKYVKTILDSCPPEYSLIQHGDGSGEITYSALVSLNCRLKNALQNHRRNEFLYEQCIQEAFEIDDIMNSYSSIEKVVVWSNKEPRTGRFANQLNTLEWIWYNYLQTPLMWILAAWFIILSMVLIWSEISVAIRSSDLSVLSNIVKHTDVNNIGIQIILFFPLGYAALTTYSTLFKIRIFNYYRLIPHQHSDANSIIFSAAYLCRLAAPLCYNYITFIHSQTTFISVMGNMDYTPFLGQYFYIYFPLLICIVCLSTLFNLYSRIMSCLNIQRFSFDTDFSHENIDEGKHLLDTERRKRRTAAMSSDLDNRIKNSWKSTATGGSNTSTSIGGKKYSLLKNAMEEEDYNYDPERGELSDSVDIYNGRPSSNTSTPNPNRPLGSSGTNKSLNSSSNSSSGNSPSNNLNSSSTVGPSPNSERLKSSFNGFPSIDKMFGDKRKDNNSNNPPNNNNNNGFFNRNNNNRGNNIR